MWQGNFTFHLLVHFPGCWNIQQLSKAEARSQELHSGFSPGSRGPSSWAIFSCLPGCISGEEDQKQNKEDSNWRSNMGSLCPKPQLNVYHNTNPGHIPFRRQSKLLLLGPTVFNRHMILAPKGSRRATLNGFGLRSTWVQILPSL